MTQRPHVLVAEGDGMVRDTLQAMLADDYEVTAAATTGVALTALASQRVDVLLLDYHLANRSGDGVVERAAEVSVPMVWMTGDLNALGAIGVGRRVLTKPFSIRGLLQALAAARGGSVNPDHEFRPQGSAASPLRQDHNQSDPTPS